MRYQIEIIRSGRKTMALEITKDARVVVRAPYWTPEAEIDRFAEEKADWIALHLIQMQNIAKKREEQRKDPKSRSLTREELRQLAQSALQILPRRTSYFAAQIGVTYGRITIRSQKTRWGSCSSDGNLNYNCLLMLTPPEVQDYVVVHELCHRKEMNHSSGFWEEVEKILPDYRERRKWLKEHGGEIMDRAFG